MSGDGRTNVPPLRWAELYQRKSARGTEYLSGRIGALRVLVMPKRAEEEGEHSHVLLVAASTPHRRDGGGQ